MRHTETTLAIGGSAAVSLFSHVFCCGLIPFALHASNGAMTHNLHVDSLAAQFGIAVLMTLAVAIGIACFERRRKVTCCDCKPGYNFPYHVLRNMGIGMIVYLAIYALGHVPDIHHFLDKLFHISHP